jgi:pyruvate/2-oxoglutarate dehydrogenase complex dihydrolipoamide dehydrogenase (E3) component
MAKKKNYDLVIIGSGPGGYVSECGLYPKQSAP